MYSALRALTLIILALGVAACVSPRYQSVYRYEAPTDEAGRACLEVCARKIAECREQCTTKTQACLKDLEPLVNERYHAALKHYEMELERYRQDLAVGHRHRLGAHGLVVHGEDRASGPDGLGRLPGQGRCRERHAGRQGCRDRQRVRLKSLHHRLSPW